MGDTNPALKMLVTATVGTAVAAVGVLAGVAGGAFLGGKGTHAVISGVEYAKSSASEKRGNAYEAALLKAAEQGTQIQSRIEQREANRARVAAAHEASLNPQQPAKPAVASPAPVAATTNAPADPTAPETQQKSQQAPAVPPLVAEAAAAGAGVATTAAWAPTQSTSPTTAKAATPGANLFQKSGYNADRVLCQSR